MKRYFYILLFLVLNCLQQLTYAQDIIVDSLKQVLNSTKQDTTKVNALNALSSYFNKKGDYLSSLSYAQQGLSLAEKQSFRPGIANSYVNIGAISNSQSHPDIALTNYYKALEIYEDLNYAKKIADIYISIGISYHDKGDSKAKVFYHKALKKYEEIKSKKGQAIALSNLGIIYLDEGKLLKNKDLGSCKYDTSKAYHIRASKVMEELHDNWNLSAMLINIANSYRQKEDYKEAITYANKSMVLAKTIGAKRIISNCYSILSEIFYKTQDYKLAYDFNQLYRVYNDSSLNEEVQQKIIQTQLNYEFEKKEAVTKAEHLAQSKQQKIIILAIMVGLILVIIFSFFLYKRFKITKKQNEVIAHQKVLVDEAYKDLHEKNKEVIDSITYARRIQRALITPEAYIDKVLNKLNKNS